MFKPSDLIQFKENLNKIDTIEMPKDDYAVEQVYQFLFT